MTPDWLILAALVAIVVLFIPGGLLALVAMFRGIWELIKHEVSKYHGRGRRGE